MKQLHIIIVMLACFTLVACEPEQPPLPPLPEGNQTMTGVIMPTQLSLKRRGTHELKVDDQLQYYLESSEVNLRRYERKRIQVQGTVEHNVDPLDTPVLVVSEIVAVEEEAFKEWFVQSLGLTLSAPEQWKGTVGTESIWFTAPGSDESVVAVYVEALLDVSGGTPIVVGDLRGIRKVDESTGAQTIYLEREEDMIILSFVPHEPVDSPRLREQWLSLLQSVSINTAKPATDTKTGSGSGLPCGGPAGILCPSGYYCDVTYVEENIGACKKY